MWKSVEIGWMCAGNVLKGMELRECVLRLCEMLTFC